MLGMMEGAMHWYYETLCNYQNLFHLPVYYQLFHVAYHHTLTITLYLLAYLSGHMRTKTNVTSSSIFFNSCFQIEFPSQFLFSTQLEFVLFLKYFGCHNRVFIHEFLCSDIVCQEITPVPKLFFCGL